MKPLSDLIVLDFSQFLAGPFAALRLADLGARVIKVEKDGEGDLCRQLKLNNLEMDGDSVLFHTINRNKESFSVNLKDSDDLEIVKKLISSADVLIQNFRPGVMEKLGLDFITVHQLNPKLVYGSITGYGKIGPWKDKPGQDLLIQSLSGLAWLNGNADQPPVPFGLAVADMLTGAYLVQGIMACLVRRGVTGQGGLVEVSLMESVLDFQFEVLTTYLNDERKEPERSSINSAHAYLGAPYGIYQTKNGYIALAMGSIPRLGELLECLSLNKYSNSSTWFSHRDEIKSILVEHLRNRTTEEWLNLLEPADYWCADVFTWKQLLDHDGFKQLNMLQQINRLNGDPLLTTRCPIRIDGNILFSQVGSPRLGEHNEKIAKELGVIKNDNKPSNGTS